MSDRFGMPIVDCRTEEERLREQVAAQAAVIEKYRLLIATFFHHYDCNIPHQGMMAEAIDELRMYEPPTDSTQILDEVRRAERERVARFVDDNCTYGDTHILVKAIRAMGDE